MISNLTECRKEFDAATKSLFGGFIFLKHVKRHEVLSLPYAFRWLIYAVKNFTDTDVFVFLNYDKRDAKSIKRCALSIRSALRECWNYGFINDDELLLLKDVVYVWYRHALFYGCLWRFM